MDKRDPLSTLQERLRESEARNRLFSDSWEQAVWETDANGVVVTDSPSWRAYTGQTLEEWLGYGWLNAIHPDDQADAERQWREAMAAQQVVNAEFRLIAPDGGWRWTNVRAAPMLDADGRIEKWVGINIDIDGRRRAEAALQESEQKFRALFETMGQGFIELALIRDQDGRPIDLHYLELNPAFERLFGVSVAEARGKRASEFFPNFDPVWTEAFDRVARSGHPERIEQTLAGRWFEVLAYPAPGGRVMALYEDVSVRKLAEIALRESEERQAFLLKLSDALRAQPDADRVAASALAVIADELRLDRCYISFFNDDENVWEVQHEFRREGLVPMPTRHRPEAYPEGIRLIGEGTLVIDDIARHPQLSDTDKASLGAMGFGSLLTAALRRGERRAIWSLVAVGSDARHWNPNEMLLMEDAAERTWAAIMRARADAALRDSEERFRQFAAASASALWIRSADTLKMEYVSPAIADIYGIDPTDILDGVELWAASIVPEDRDRALAHLEEPRQGKAVVHEFRIQRQSDYAFRWIRNTDFPLFDPQGQVQRIGGIAEDVTEAKLAVEHQGVLLAELQHRVRNIMAMIRSMVRRSAEGAGDVEEYRTLLEGRLLALARVQTLLTRQANTGGTLRDIVESEVGAQAHHGGQFELVGPDVQLSPKAVEVLTLALHELATNALKYGALSVPEGRLRVEWTPFEKRDRTWLAIDWVERGAPSRGPVTRRGFGSDLIEGKIPYELGGTGRISIEPTGARCRLEFPLKEGESILETDAPSPTIVFGGTLDMTGAPDLTGRSVLVVEDDYYIAGDTAAALRGAGATVLGPCPSEDATLDLLETATPTHAVLDLNLGGGGPRFAIAHALKERGVPFIFLTGYDPDAVPPELADIVRLQKPVPFRTIVEAVGQLA